MAHNFYLLSLYAAIITAFFYVRRWRQRRKAKRDAEAIKLKGVLLDVSYTGVKINNQRQFDFKIELIQDDGTSKNAIITQTFNHYRLPNAGDEVVVCINPEDKYDRWILR